MRPPRWVEWLSLSEPTRRALEETTADGDYERRLASTARTRMVAGLRRLAAIARVLVSMAGVLDEGYPMRNFGRDLVYAVRRLRSAPAFTIFSVATLAVGIGATTAVVSIVRDITGPPAGVMQPENVVYVFHTSSLNLVDRSISWADYRDYKKVQTSFSSLTAYAYTHEAILANGRSEGALGEIVDGDYFTVLGVRPALGRTLQPSDDRPGAPPVVVISDLLWRRDFDAAPNVVGRTVVVNGLTVPIVGVAPASFQGLFNGGLVPSVMWLPMSVVPLMNSPGYTDRLDDDRDNRWLQVLGRLEPAIPLAQGQAEARVIARQLDAAYPLGRDLDANWRRRAPLVSRQWTLRRLVDGVKLGNAELEMPIFVSTVFTAIGLVLLVACTNLANLTVARGTLRRHDVAVRLAMGATRWRLLREELTESVGIILGGAVAGLGLAAVLLARIRTDIDLGPSVLHLTPALDRAAFLAALVATALALAVAGVVPAWLSTRADVRTALGADGAGAALPRWRGRQWLITMQVAVSLIFLSLATVAAYELNRDLARDTGVSLDRLAVATIDFAEQRVDDMRARQMAEQIVAQLTREPGVSIAAAMTGMPFGITNPECYVTTLDKPLVPDKYVGTVGGFIATTPNGLRAIGVQILKGRGPSERDGEASQSVAIVSASLANKLFGTTDVVGRLVQVQMSQWAGMPTPPIVTRTVVGVASDTDEVAGKPELTVYLPLAQQTWGQLTFVARTDGDPTMVVPALRRAITAVAPMVATSEIGTATSVTGASEGPLEVLAGVTGLLGTFALVLALTGLYGVLSHVVARRVREMGVRVALGATSRQIVQLIVGDGLRPVVFGVLFGLVAVAIARMALGPILIRAVPTLDLMAAAVAPAAILVAGWFACYVPARRAARIDPNTALREL